MDKFVLTIKKLIKDYFDSCSSAEPINNPEDYYRVKRWVKKVRKLYIIFTIFALIEIPIFLSIPSWLENLPFLITLLLPFLLILTNWGYATLIIYLPHIVKSLLASLKVGYNIGEKIETTHVHVTHKFGNTYNISTHTENKGLIFAYIAAVVRFLTWAFFSVYIGPFLTMKKLRNSIKNIKSYKHTNVK